MNRPAHEPQSPPPKPLPSSRPEWFRGAGAVLFWLGAATMFSGSWLVMWWIAPFWRARPPSDLEGTVWSFGGLVFMTIALSVPVGMLLSILGTLLSSGAGRRNIGVVLAVTGLIAAATMFPSTLGYYPIAFGISGGVIIVSFLAAIWFWGRRRRRLDGAEATVADIQLAGYVAFFFAATLTCSMLGNPFGGLFFPERVLRDASMPWYYSMGLKIALFLAFGWVCVALGQYRAARGR